MANISEQQRINSVINSYEKLVEKLQNTIDQQNKHIVLLTSAVVAQHSPRVALHNGLIERQIPASHMDRSISPDTIERDLEAMVEGT